MNNCYANYGSTNARELARILADLKPAPKTTNGANVAGYRETRPAD